MMNQIDLWWALLTAGLIVFVTTVPKFIYKGYVNFITFRKEPFPVDKEHRREELIEVMTSLVELVACTVLIGIPMGLSGDEISNSTRWSIIAIEVIVIVLLAYGVMYWKRYDKLLRANLS